MKIMFVSFMHPQVLSKFDDFGLNWEPSNDGINKLFNQIFW